MPAEAAAPVAALATAGFLDREGRSIFVWHHPPPPHARRHAAVILCPPLGYESMSAYPSLRILAERLAAIGFDAIRFDYDGTGNSSGSGDDPDRVAAWVRSIGAVIEAAGSTAIALIGVRAGVLLALQAARARGGVDRLVLWGSPASGRAYVRELKAIAGLSRQQYASEDEGPGINAAGHVMSEEAVAALRRWTIDEVDARPASQVLLVDRDDRPADNVFEDRLRTLGACVARIRPPGTSGMLLQTQLATVPHEALDAIVAWFDTWKVGGARPAGLELSPLGEADRVVRFGCGDRLFGILSSPAEESTAPAIILFNTGVERHIGPHRMYVPLARHWAANGHVVLRFDVGGVGDSAPPAGAEAAGAYPAYILDDAAEAIAFVRRVAPGRRVIVAGMCSGGWLAFRAAREGLPVDAIVAVNPPLYLRERAAGLQWVEERHELGRYRQSMRDPARWVKALRGRASYATLARLAAAAIARRANVRRAALTGVAGDSLAADLVAIARRGIPARFVFSEGDDGLAYFTLNAPPALRDRGVHALLSHVVVPGAGHTFRPRAAQEELRRLLLEFIAVQMSEVGGNE
jgi:alpha-beta hydrolase superfamily lysophospholipase